MERSIQRSPLVRGASVSTKGSGRDTIGYLVSRLTQGLNYRFYVYGKLQEASLCTGIPLRDLQDSYEKGEKVVWDTDNKPKE